MSEGLTHPGYINITQLSERAGRGSDHHSKFIRLLNKERSKITFDDFKRFIVTDGMQNDTKDKFIRILELAFNKDGESWKPGVCEHSPSLDREIKQIMSRDQTFGGIEASVRRYNHSHFWVTLDFGDGKTIIVDPFGIPKDFPEYITGDDENILPYFGAIEFAQDYAKKVYEQGKQLDDWGTRSLPQGFHP